LDGSGLRRGKRADPTQQAGKNCSDYFFYQNILVSVSAFGF
jgi:hypothetical protein